MQRTKRKIHIKIGEVSQTRCGINIPKGERTVGWTSELPTEKRIREYLKSKESDYCTTCLSMIYADSRILQIPREEDS